MRWGNSLVTLPKKIFIWLSLNQSKGCDIIIIIISPVILLHRWCENISTLNFLPVSKWKKFSFLQALKTEILTYEKCANEGNGIFYFEGRVSRKNRTLVVENSNFTFKVPFDNKIKVSIYSR